MIRLTVGLQLHESVRQCWVRLTISWAGQRYSWRTLMTCTWSRRETEYSPGRFLSYRDVSRDGTIGKNLSKSYYVCYFAHCINYHFYTAAMFKKESAYSVYRKWRHTTQITNDRPVYILPKGNYNVYCPIIGHLFCMMIFYRHYAYGAFKKYSNPFVL